MSSHLHRGDTIIEVMIAFTVFSMLAVGAMAVMNRGVSTAQDALETTLVRQQIDNQAETLRFLHQAYISDRTVETGSGRKFKELLDLNSASPTKFGAENCVNAIPAGSNNIFMLDPSTGTKLDTTNIRPAGNVNAPAYAQVTTNGSGQSYGLWVEKVDGDPGVSQQEFVDFHIRACWFGTSNDVPRTLGTIVRLYVPTN